MRPIHEIPHPRSAVKAVLGTTTIVESGETFRADAVGGAALDGYCAAVFGAREAEGAVVVVFFTGAEETGDEGDGLHGVAVFLVEEEVAVFAAEGGELFGWVGVVFSGAVAAVGAAGGGRGGGDEDLGGGEGEGVEFVGEDAADEGVEG